MDCTLPAGVREPDSLERAYIVGAQGRFYRTRWRTIIAEQILGRPGDWSLTPIEQHEEVATSSARGLPTPDIGVPMSFADGRPIPRVMRELERSAGAGARWIPAVAIVADPARGERLAHGWVYGTDLDAIASSEIAANAIRYDIAVQRCAQAAAAPLEHQTVRTSTVTTETGTPAESLLRNFNFFPTPDATDDGAKAGADEQPTVVSSGMTVAIVGTLVAVGALGLIVWAASGDGR